MKNTPTPTTSTTPTPAAPTTLLWFLVLMLVLFVSVVLAIGIGSVSIAVPTVLAGLWEGLSGRELAGEHLIVWQVRLPRVLMAVVVGAALAACGVAFQGVFQNPLAEPYLLGLAGGAAFGVTLALTLGLGSLLIPPFAMVTALLSVACTLMLAREGRRFAPIRLILAGVVVGSILTAATTALILRGEDRARQVLAYTLGNLSFSGWGDFFHMLPYVVIGCGLLFALSRALDTLQLGDLTASSLGLPVNRLRVVVVVVASFVTAAVVSEVGIIGFVGLIVPHLTRLIVGTRHAALLPCAMVLGSSLLVLADLVARTTPLSQVGIVTSLLGGPFFLWLLRRQRL